MKDKVTVKDIRKAVKILEKHKIKPDKDGFIEIEDPTIGVDFLYLKKIEKKGTIINTDTIKEGVRILTEFNKEEYNFKVGNSVYVKKLIKGGIL